METITVDNQAFQAIQIPTENTTLYLIQGGKGFLACGYVKVEVADRVGDAAAIVTGVNSYQDMLEAKVVQISAKARELGVREGCSGREALLALA